MTKPKIERLIEFHEFLNKFAEIERVVHVKRHEQHVLESDTEHSYNLAMTAWFLASSFKELNQEKVLKLALVHDLVEIHAGDTYVFADEEMLESKHSREAEAMAKIKVEWADFSDMVSAIEEYEARKTPEACFVYALDKVMPNIAIYLNEGHTWKEKQITLSDLNNEKKDKVKLAPEIERYWVELHKLLEASPHLFGNK